MRFPLLTTLLALTPFTPVHALRNYDTHDYYAVHLDSGASPQDVASHLGLEYESRLGPLDDHYLFRYPKHDHDIIDLELKAHKRRKRSIGSDYENSLLDSIRLNQKQVLKPPKQKRPALPVAAPIGQSTTQGGQQGSTEPSKDPAVQKQQEIARQLDIQDPMFQEQWHRFSSASLRPHRCSRTVSEG